jgi:alanine racemase
MIRARSYSADGLPLLRPTVAIINADAITANVRALHAHVAPAMCCAVVKADGYGHGAVTAAKAALRGGAQWLAVALVEEGLELRAAGIGAPILVLSEFPAGAASFVVEHNLMATVYSAERIAEIAAAASKAGRVSHVHLKVDTGMRRVGAQLSEVMDLAKSIIAAPSLELGGTFTHFAVSDEPSNSFTATQTERFIGVLNELRAAGIDPGIVHASNSGAGIIHTAADPSPSCDMVRFGVAIYGNSPDDSLDTSTYGVALEPVLTLRSEVSHVKVVAVGEAVSYGLIWSTTTDRIIATVPIGYADGVPRSLGTREADVLLGGRRCRIVGRVTMDQILIDAGPASNGIDVNRGDDVILIGRQGSEQITPAEWAIKTGTIAYEITCGISKRVPRIVIGPAE